jgi:tRNA dimethylallyltransferase
MVIKYPNVVVIAGPTASGKSDLAITMARTFNGEIISADSRQVYRGMDKGTGKITRRERKLVRHWLIDVASPRHRYTVAHFKRDAQKAIRTITNRGKLPIICGGTGFWIDTLIYDRAIPNVKPDPKLRSSLQKLSPEELFSRLQRLDPARAKSIDRQNPVRLIRALEIVMGTGLPVPPGASGKGQEVSPYTILYLTLNPSPSTLRTRIEKRLDARLKAGMVAEVQRLHAEGLSWKRLESFGLEYRWVAQYLQGTITRSAMREGLLRDIIRYSKRQLTWWRSNKNVTWIQRSTEASTLIHRFLTSINK